LLRAKTCSIRYTDDDQRELNQADEKVTRVISARRASRKERNMKSKKIDFSDIPQLSDKQLSRMRRV
jgi:hypothetical protein